MSPHLLWSREVPDLCFFAHSQSVFLGFDPSAKTCKILRALKGKSVKYEIFTLGGQSWRILEDGPGDPPKRKEIFHNGTIYWGDGMTVWQNGTRIMENRMLAFDFGEEKFRSVPTPLEHDSNRWANRHCRLLSGVRKNQ